MLSPRKAVQATKLYLTHWLKSEKNKARIQAVLQDNFKPLFGVDGTIYLIAHQHSSPKDDKEAVNAIVTVNKSHIESFLSRDKIQEQVDIYQKDMEWIWEIIKYSAAKTIYIEEEPYRAEKWLNEAKKSYGTIEWVMTTLWFSQQDTERMTLFLLGPVYYLYSVRKLDNIKILGMEWEHKDEAVEIIQKLYNDYSPEEGQQMIEKLKKNIVKRDKDMANNIMTGGKGPSIAIFWAAHHDGIKELLRNWNFSTNSKYSTDDKSMRKL